MSKLAELCCQVISDGLPLVIVLPASFFSRLAVTSAAPFFSPRFFSEKCPTVSHPSHRGCTSKLVMQPLDDEGFLHGELCLSETLFLVVDVTQCHSAHKKSGKTGNNLRKERMRGTKGVNNRCSCFPLVTDTGSYTQIPQTCFLWAS